MITKKSDSYVKWLGRCENWNWNLSLAEVAKELIEDGVKPDSQEFKDFSEAYNEYFADSEGCGQKGPIIYQTEAIQNILETFGG
jgi:hypothetical protein